MKRFLCLLFFILALAASVSVYMIFNALDFHGIMIIVEFLAATPSVVLAWFFFSLSHYWFGRWQFDVQFKEMIRDFENEASGPIALHCSHQELYTQFRKHYRHRLQGIKGFDSDRGLFEAIKI